jgi:hypothetical protein
MAGTRRPSNKKPAATKPEPTALDAASALVSQHMPQVLQMLGGTPLPMLPGNSTIALPLGSQQTLIGALKTRPNWYTIARRDIDALARLVVERNWFARTVHRARVGVYSYGFQFSTKEARDWAAPQPGAERQYPFRAYQEDMIEEWHVSRCIIVWWRKDSPPGVLPVLHCPNVGEVEYKVIAGVEQISVRMARSSLTDDDVQIHGKRLSDIIKKGGSLLIKQGDPDFDFRVMKEGKTGGPLPVSPLVTIFDDLDFIEAIRIGDWNGAKSRWEIIRHTKKGYAVTSGNNAGHPRNNAKTSELKAILKAMKEILGKQDVVTNFDQEIEWLTFPKEHFHEDLLAEVKQRLLFWSGVFGVLLLKTDSQITGLSTFMMDQLRAEVLAFREKFTDFLTSIYQSESFRKGIPNAPLLIPTWSVKPLYSSKALIELCTALTTYAIAAPQTVRELFGFDDDEESDLLLKAHEDPLRYTPAFEPRQGITAAIVSPPEPTGNQNQNALPGSPGRPGES